MFLYIFHDLLILFKGKIRNFASKNYPQHVYEDIILIYYMRSADSL